MLLIIHIIRCWAGSSTSLFVFFSFDIPLLVVLIMNIALISRVVYHVFAEFSANDEVLNPILSARNVSFMSYYRTRIQK